MSRKALTDAEIKKGFPPIPKPLPPPPEPPAPPSARQDSGRQIAEGGPRPQGATIPFQGVLDQCASEIGRLNVRILTQAEQIKHLLARLASTTQELEKLKKGLPPS